MKRFLLIAACCALALSCTQEATLSLYADVPTAQFGPEGGSFNTILFTNGSSWTATCEDPTVVFSPTSGAYSTPMHIEVGENTEHYTKAIRIAVTSELDGNSRRANIVVTQACHPFVICDDNQKTVGVAGGIVRFTVNSDRGWYLVETQLDGVKVVMEDYFDGWIAPSWCDEPNNCIVEFSIPANNTGKKRTWSAILSPKEEGLENCLLTVMQSAK